MSDSEKEIKKKINQHAFSGGQETLELHRELGGDPDVDVPYQYITYFEDDDDKVAKFAEEYRKGAMLTGDMKKECIALMTAYVTKFKDARAKVTDEVLDSYLKPRKLEWNGNPNVEKPKAGDGEEVAGESTMTGEDGKPLTKNQQKKLAKQAELERKKKEKEAAKPKT